MVNFGRDHVWVLDEDGEPDVEAIAGFLAEHGDQPFLVFGFTFMVWLYLYEVAREQRLDLSQRHPDPLRRLEEAGRPGRRQRRVPPRASPPTPG